MKNITAIIFGIVLFLSACDMNQKDIICTEEFSMVTIEITGEKLDEHYTVRESTNDTIRPYHYSFDGVYTVLDDNYLPEFKNSRDKFTFVGLINNQLVVSEKIIIKADECHVEKVRGADKIELTY